MVLGSAILYDNPMRVARFGVEMRLGDASVHRSGSS